MRDVCDLMILKRLRRHREQGRENPHKKEHQKQVFHACGFSGNPVPQRGDKKVYGILPVSGKELFQKAGKIDGKSGKQFIHPLRHGIQIQFLKQSGLFQAFPPPFCLPRAAVDFMPPGKA